jgi:hypothetical protein
VKAYYSRQARTFLIGGITVLGLAVIGVLSFRDPPIYLFGVALLPLFVGVSLKYIPLVRLFDDRIEVTRGLLGREKSVPLGEIERVITNEDKSILLETRQGRVIIPIFALHEWERREILLRLGGPG